MKLNKEELLTKIQDYDISDDIKVELLENVTDSIDESVVVDDLKKTIDELSTERDSAIKERDDYKQRYIDRFSTNESIKIVNTNPLDDVKEKEYIDIKSI